MSVNRFLIRQTFRLCAEGGCTRRSAPGRSRCGACITARELATRPRRDRSAWRAKNRERIRETWRAWNARTGWSKTRKRDNARQRELRAQNREHARAINRASYHRCKLRRTA